MTLSIARPPRPELPTGWPRERYQEWARAKKVGLIVWQLLATGTVWSAEQATDDVIDAAARDVAAGPKPPSDTTRNAVRKILADLIPTPLPEPDGIQVIRWEDGNQDIAETVMDAARHGDAIEITTADGRTVRYLPADQ